MKGLPERAPGRAAGGVARLRLEPPTPFDLAATCTNHGWAALAPFAWDRATRTLRRVDILPGGPVVRLEVRQGPSGAVGVAAGSPWPLDRRSRRLLAERVGAMLRLDENLSEFEALCDRHPRWRGRVRPGGARLLRSPTVFEDVVKTVCTTNTTWRQTKAMVKRLVDALGAPFPGQPEARAFPAPEQVAACGEDRLRAEIRLGYRARYVAALAERVASGALDLEALRSPEMPDEDVRRAVRALPGVGPYAAATILMLLGRYGEVAVDSELRAFTAKHYFPGAPPTDAQIRALYADWGRWKYLAHWFDPGQEAQAGATP